MTSDKIFVVYGDEPRSMMNLLLDRIDPASRISRGGRIGIKPNLVVAKPSSSGATTEPAIVEALIEHLRSGGHEDIVILESAWVGDSTRAAFEVCGYNDISRRTGVPLIDLKSDSSTRKRAGGIEIEVCNATLDIDFLINVPVLKAHCQTRMTCALKNLKGCIPDREKRRFHTLRLHRPIAALNRVIETGLVIVDGIIGDLTYEEGGTPVCMNRIIAGEDPVLVDAYAASLMGYSPQDIEYIALAQEMGVGSADLDSADIIELNRTGDVHVGLPEKGNTDSFADLIDEDQACSACYGGLLHAIQRLSDSGEPARIGGSAISIGQGFKDRHGAGIGVGDCTSGLEHHLAGCPPTARDMVEFLRKKTS